MYEDKLLSIITINLDNLEGLKKTMASVLEQTYNGFEYIIIDGGSTDGSKEYIETKSPKLNYWLSEPDEGIYHAMNKGIKVAKGDYLLFLNSGDYFYSKFILEENRNFLGGEDLVYFNVQVGVNKNSPIVSYPKQLRFSDLLYGTICHQAIFFKKEIFEKVGLYDESLQVVSDWKFLILALFKYNCEYKGIENTLTVYDIEGLSAGLNMQKKINTERETVINEHFKSLLLEFSELEQFKIKVQELRKSKKIQVLIRMGLINDF